MFGSIPLVPAEVVDARGKPWTTWRFDLGWQPPLPRGAVRGDPRRQTFCCDPPRYFYIDEPRVCVQCGEPFVFSAAEQKYWYETLEFRLDANAVRCRLCRRRRRSDRAIRQTLALAVTATSAHPTDPIALIALVQATLSHVERFGTGNLDRALSACRRSWKLASFSPARYWEGRVQELAGRREKAQTAYRSFLEDEGPSARPVALVRDAEARLTRITQPGT